MTWGRRRALVILILVLLVIAILWIFSSSNRIPANSILVLDVNGTIEEQRPDGFLAALGAAIPVFHDYVDVIDTARADPRVSGLVVKIGPLATGWAKLEEIRSHILEFRKSGKPSICYLDADGIGNPEYYLASSCQQVWLMPTDPMSIKGMMAEATFLRGTLDKLKIVPDFYHIAEYKTATNELTEKKFTPAHREEVDSLLHSVYNQYLTDVSASRQMSRSDFESLVQKGPFEADEALNAKLVDRLAYWDQVQQFFKNRLGAWNPVEMEQYRGRVKNEGAEKIAVVHATGLIVSGESADTVGGGFVMGGDSVSADLREAREDSSIRAIVLRIDSGGGSAVASEVIRREVELAAKAKPVVVSMSDVAASGGYWISMSANKIVADPNTITASIGVLTGKMNLSGLYGLLGLSTDYVATGDNATMEWDQQNFTPAQQQSLQKSLQDIYASFTKGVAAGRHMTVEAVDKIGKGRVWSGSQAKDIGLVDELGGLDRAIQVARQLAHIPSDESVRIERFPQERSLFQQLIEREEGQGSIRVTNIEAMLRRIGISMEPVQLSMPFELKIR